MKKKDIFIIAGSILVVLIVICILISNLDILNVEKTGEPMEGIGTVAYASKETLLTDDLKKLTVNTSYKVTENTNGYYLVKKTANVKIENKVKEIDLGNIQANKFNEVEKYQQNNPTKLVQLRSDSVYYIIELVKSDRVANKKVIYIFDKNGEYIDNVDFNNYVDLKPTDEQDIKLYEEKEYRFTESDIYFLSTKSDGEVTLSNPESSCFEYQLQINKNQVSKKINRVLNCDIIGETSN